MTTSQRLIDRRMERAGEMIPGPGASLIGVARAARCLPQPRFSAALERIGGAARRRPS